jgi:inositol-pentakisphosphate 2-kinase
MELTLTEEDAANWVYRGEGAANIVLSYTGSSPSYVSSFFFFFFVSACD